MENSIEILNFNNGNPVRWIRQGEEIWFVGKDVAEALNYTNPQKALRDHVDTEDKGVNETFTPRGGNQKTIIINESGLYSLIFSSKLPIAKEFKRWVTSVVLPTIHRTGAYQLHAEREAATISTTGQTARRIPVVLEQGADGRFYLEVEKEHAGKFLTIRDGLVERFVQERLEPGTIRDFIAVREVYHQFLQYQPEQVHVEQRQFGKIIRGILPTERARIMIQGVRFYVYCGIRWK